MSGVLDPHAEHFPIAIPAIKAYPYFEPGAVNRLTVAVDGDLLLPDIVGASVMLGDNPYANSEVPKKFYGLTWRPETVALEINGREAVRLTAFGKKFGPGQSLDLGWPAPAPIFTPPIVVLPRQKSVRPLSQKVGRQDADPGPDGARP
jgi:hypothetical protein